MYKCSVQCFPGFGYNQYSTDVSSITSHSSLEEDRERDDKAGKYYGDGLLEYVDDEVRASCVW